jgi:hypothetical protein
MSPVDKSAVLDCLIIECQDMKTNQVPIIAAFAGSVILLLVQASRPVQAKSSFAGTWEGKMNNLPGIDLKIEDADGKVSGVMIFYFQERSDASAPWHVASESPVPLLVPHVERKTLTFEVQHHKCHTCPELRPNVKFRMELAGPDEALLWKLANEEQEKNKELGPGLKLVRQSESPPGHN